MKEEPLSEEDLRAVQKDRQKKDNHNMSKYSKVSCPQKLKAVQIFCKSSSNRGSQISQDIKNIFGH